ncbi:ribonuclease HII [Knoellia sp. S7-12]|uniref:ribonuclease HII n=1 Tax=Knoellia sp. S7-12 TaxID=3126698 RepID=UPI0033665599
MPPASRSRKPSLRVERALQRDGYRLLAGMDEVGRGALAGPVSVGVVVIDETCRSAPQGVRDSKLLQPRAREVMVPRIRRWAFAHAVGHASPAEIDAVGIIAALRLAGRRALASLDVVPDLVILDGNHDWLTAPGEVGLLAYTSDDVHTPPVTTMIKADMKCSSVASASVLAKVERDAMMVDLAPDHAAYRWDLNKGYAAPEHMEALREHGPTELHRRSWRLPGTMDDDGDFAEPDAVAVITPPLVSATAGPHEDGAGTHER